MSKTVEAYNYRIGLDVSSLKAGGVLTRAELSLLRRDFGSLQSPVERAEKSIDRLLNAMNKGAIDSAQYAEAVARINARLPETIASTKAMAEAQKQAQSIQRGLMSDEQLYAAEMKRVIDLVRSSNLSREEATRHLREYRATMPSAVAAQRELNEAERASASIRASLMTDAERYAAEQSRINGLVELGKLGQDEAAEAMRRYQATLPSAVSAQRELADAERQAADVRRSLMTDAERLATEQERLNNLVARGKLEQSTADAALTNYRSTLSSVVAEERQRASLQERGAALTRRYATESERLAQQLAEERRELEELRAAGTIDASTFDRGVADIETRANPGQADAERQAVEIRKSLQTETAKLQAEQDRLNDFVARGVLEQEEAAEAMRRYQATLPSTVAAQRELADAERQRAELQERGAALTRRYATESEKLALQLGAERNALEEARAAGTIDATTFDRGVADIQSRATPGQADAERQALEIRKSLQTETAKLQAEQDRLNDFVARGVLEQDEAAEAMRRYQATLPSTVTAQRELADAERQASDVRRSLMTDAERLAAEQERLNRIVAAGTLTQQDADRAITNYRAGLASVKAEEAARADIQRRGATLTDKYATETEKLTRRLAEERQELERLRRAGAISQSTFDRGMTDIGRQSRGVNRPQWSTALTQMPGIGGLAGQGAQLAALGGPLAAVAVAVGGVVVAYRTAAAAMRIFTEGIADQARQVADLERNARLTGTSVAGLIAIQVAAADSAGMSADQTLTVVTKLSAKISEAAAGGGEALATLKELGLNPIELSTQDPADAFRTLVQAISQVENPSDRARMAMKLFEEEGIGMANMLKDGVAGLDAAERKAREYGLSLNSVDASGIRIAKQSVDDLSQMWQGWTRQIAVEFAPLMTSVAQTVGLMVPKAGEFKGEVRGVADASVEIVANFADLLELLGRIASYGDKLKYLNPVGTFVASQAANRLGMAMDESAADSAGTRIRENYRRAREEAEALAAKNEEVAKAGREAAQQNQVYSQSLTQTFEQERKQLEERKLQLELGVDAAADYNLQTSKVSEELKKDIEELRIRNKELERADEIRNRASSLDEELAKAREVAAVRAELAGIDDATIEQQAELRLLGASGNELAQHLNTRREIVALQKSTEAFNAERDRIKQLTDDAKELRNSFRLPITILAEDFAKLDEMRARDLLTAQEYERAKREAAEALAEVPDNVATNGIDLGDGSAIYAALVEEQNAKRKAELQRDEAARLQAAADALNAKDKERLGSAIAITDQMKQQSTLASRITAVADRPTGQTPAANSFGTNGEEYLRRIAEASEQTSEHLSNWEIIGV